MPIFLPGISHRLIDINALVSIYAIVQISYITHSGHYLEWEDDKLIKLSDIVPFITFFVEDFNNLKNKLLIMMKSFLINCIIFIGMKKR